MRSASIVGLALVLLLAAAAAAQGATHDLKGYFVPYYDSEDFVIGVNTAADSPSSRGSRTWRSVSITPSIRRIMGLIIM